MALSISAHYPEAQLKDSEFSQALTRAAMALAAQKTHPAQISQPEIEIAFMLSGDLESPGFTGMRLRTYSAAEQLLQIDSAVPKPFNNSSQAKAYILAALQDAAENAEEFLATIKVPFALGSHMELIASLEANVILA